MKRTTKRPTVMIIRELKDDDYAPTTLCEVDNKTPIRFNSSAEAETYLKDKDWGDDNIFYIVDTIAICSIEREVKTRLVTKRIKP